MDFELLKTRSSIIRSQIFETIVKAGKGHIGGALSCTDILVALYYGGIINFNLKDPDWAKRDRFILSKGHSAVALFTVLADLGFLDKAELDTVCKDGSRLGEHPDKRIPGIEIDSGSLGHGIGIGAGIALSAKMDSKDYNIIVLVGDGECYEGSVWEAFMFAAHYQLNNLMVIIDRNQQITLDYTEDCICLDPLADKLTAFGWDVAEVDGHNFEELITALSCVKDSSSLKPKAVIANTVKGKGISFMEGQLKWHHGMPDSEEIDIARRELALTLHE